MKTAEENDFVHSLHVEQRKTYWQLKDWMLSELLKENAKLRERVVGLEGRLNFLEQQCHSLAHETQNQQAALLVKDEALKYEIENQSHNALAMAKLAGAFQAATGENIDQINFLPTMIERLRKALSTTPTAAKENLEKVAVALRIIYADSHFLNLEWFEKNGHEGGAAVTKNLRKFSEVGLEALKELGIGGEK